MLHKPMLVGCSDLGVWFCLFFSFWWGIKTGGFILFFKLLFLGVIFLKNIKTQVLKSIGQIIVWSLVICFIFLLTITRYSGSYSCHTILSRSRSPLITMCCLEQPGICSWVLKPVGEAETVTMLANLFTKFIMH